MSSISPRRVDELPPVRFDPEPGREIARKHLAYALMALLAATVAAGFVLVFTHTATMDDTVKFVAIFLTAESGLVGSALGFYFSSPPQN
jgi:hypothetical protein